MLTLTGIKRFIEGKSSNSCGIKMVLKHYLHRLSEKIHQSLDLDVKEFEYLLY